MVIQHFAGFAADSDIIRLYYFVLVLSRWNCTCAFDLFVVVVVIVVVIVVVVVVVVLVIVLVVFCL